MIFRIESRMLLVRYNACLNKSSMLRNCFVNTSDSLLFFTFFVNNEVNRFT